MGMFRPFNATNEPGTCAWCGAKLRKTPEHVARHTRGTRGDYGDDAFCGLRCGYQFGVQMDVNGRRLKPKAA